ncbi:hypothetical protein VN24_07780 [Paenibacillus beijingensis]|uniref:Acyltransferase 3 domain-containing protein n=2 Tax=Paenibacillus beijingensis TaxID=1126833 RepID=A0A0D5NQJ7_9BACL|nr:hypothetical protein VN24_07780 [Paenibacillus beijingensis]
MRKERIPELELLRGLAILGVIMVHATSAAVVRVHDSPMLGVYVFLNTFALFCVPAFIFLTGFVLFYNYYDKPLTLGMLRNFYWKRLTQLLIPYIVISAGYELLGHMANHRAWNPGAMLSLFWQHLLSGKAYTHLYYVIITIQLYVLFPLLLLLFQRLKMSVRLAVPLGLIIQWGFYLLNRNVLHVASKGSWSLSYFTPFLIGAFFGMCYPVFKRWFGSGEEAGNGGESGRRRTIWTVVMTALWLAVTAAFIWMYYELRSGGVVIKGYWYEAGYSAFTVLTTLALMKLCGFLYRKGPQWIVSALTDLGALSFGIYLVHPLILYVYRKFPPGSAQPLIYHSWIAGGYVVALGGSIVILLAAYRLLGWSWILFGPVPARFGRQAKQSGVQSAA